MKKQLFSFLLVVSFVASGFGQSVKPAKVSDVEKRLREHVEYLASPKLEGRRTGEPGATMAAEYIAKMFKKIKLKPGQASGAFLQEFSYTPSASPHGPSASEAAQPPRIGYNVIGILEGRDEVLKKEAIVIGAHYDHLGRGGSGSLAMNSTEIHHGADDNASGTAAMIDVARQFAKEKKNRRTLIFIAFSGEEEGLFGSKHYVNNPVFPIENTVAMINLDMVGRLNEDKLNIGGIGTATEWKALVETENRYTSSVPGADTAYDASRMPVKFLLTLNEDGFGPSDHSSFYGKKVPVLFFFSGTHLDYHKPTDTAEKINYAGLEKIRWFVRDLLYEIDGNQARPTYAVAKSSGMGGRTGFNISLGTMPSYAETGDGMIVDGVRDSSPAAKAGMKAGDKVVMLAGKEIKNVMDYTNAMSEMSAGVEYEVVVVRGGERLTLKVIPVKR